MFYITWLKHDSTFLFFSWHCLQFCPRQKCLEFLGFFVSVIVLINSLLYHMNAFVTCRVICCLLKIVNSFVNVKLYLTIRVVITYGICCLATHGKQTVLSWFLRDIWLVQVLFTISQSVVLHINRLVLSILTKMNISWRAFFLKNFKYWSFVL